MHGQHRLKYLRFAAAAWLFVGSALIGLQAQAAGSGSTASSAVLSPPSSWAAAPTPTASATARPAAAHTAAQLGPIDHAAWISTRPPDVRPGDHVLIIQRPFTNTASSAAGAASSQAAAVPQAQHTPALLNPQPVSGAAPAAQPQPIAARTPSAGSIATNQVPAPAATPKLSPIDHMLVLTAPPTNARAAAPSTDHRFRLDHQADDLWSPGRQLLASLHLPEDHLTEGEALLGKTRDESCYNPMSWTVIVHKSAYLLDVYYKGKHFDSFPAVFGRNPDHSAKEWEGDLRTPEGNYLIVEKYYNPRWRWFLRLNYPNY
jgi:hypothetical protein